MSTQAFYANVDRGMDQSQDFIVIDDDDDDSDDDSDDDGKTVSFTFRRILLRGETFLFLITILSCFSFREWLFKKIVMIEMTITMIW